MDPMSANPGGGKFPLNLGRTIHEEQDRQAERYGGHHDPSPARRIVAAVVAIAAAIGALALWSSGSRILAVMLFALIVPAAVILAVEP
jgi:predicted lysophospholipase L1 biosynthesis ABC-type transport system permease subunit